MSNPLYWEPVWLQVTQMIGLSMLVLILVYVMAEGKKYWRHAKKKKVYVKGWGLRDV